MRKKLYRWFETIGYARAAGELQRMGYHDIAKVLDAQHNSK